ncbi:MAG: DbpA RNA binding domain-containing protein [Gemmatimonadaceae bacterium]
MGEEKGEGAARSQMVVLQGPADARTMAAAMRPGIERSRETGESGPACLLICPTVEQALSAADQARLLLADLTARVVPVSQVARARRVIANGPVAVIAGTPADLLALRKDAALPLDHLKAVILIGLDDLLAAGAIDALRALLGDIPSDALRVATVDTEGPDVTEFLDAQLRKARRIAPPSAIDAPLAVVPQYLITAANARGEAVRDLLDALDPPSLLILTANEVADRAAHEALTRLGLVVDGHAIQVARQATTEHVALVVLWEAPAAAETLTAALAIKPIQAVTLLTPDELPAFLRLTAGSAMAWASPARSTAASGRVAALRNALVEALHGPATRATSTLAVLVPLLEAHDAVALAAAALHLYETALDTLAERSASMATLTALAAQAPLRAGASAAGAGATLTGPQRLFLGVGKRDGVRVGDLVGAIANEAGIEGSRIGGIELFESHALVELAAEDAMKAVKALESVSVRGRRLNARIDDRAGGGGDRPMRSGPRPGAGPRGPREGGREGGRDGGRDGGFRDRAPRSGGRDGGSREGGREGGRPSGPRPGGPRPSGPRSGPREGGSRDSGPRGTFRADEARRAFGDRPARERAEGTREWSERGTRMANAKRPPRPPRSND